MHSAWQELLREAAKAQLRRMCTPKKKRVSLNVPDWVVQAFKSRPQNETATLLMNCNFDKARPSYELMSFAAFGHQNFFYRISIWHYTMV